MPGPSLAAVSYLNTVPLIWGFLHGPQKGRARIEFLVPGLCAEAVRTGSADAGLVPVVEVARQGLAIMADTGIACHGPVKSIVLLSKTAPHHIRTLAADSSSRTSVMLARIILAERFGVRDLEVNPLPPDPRAMLARHDAALVIGDPALRLVEEGGPGPGVAMLDLGAEWWRLTGLPMVFAAWAGKPEAAERLRGIHFDGSLGYGLTRMEDYLEDEAARRGLAAGAARDYLLHHIVYQIGEEERRGMNRYLGLAAALDAAQLELTEELA